MNPTSTNPFTDFASMQTFLNNSKSTDELYQNIVNAPFTNKLTAAFLGLGIIVFLLKNEQEGVIDRIALSQTDHAEDSKKHSVKPFHEIKIPLDHTDNIIAKTISQNEPHQTDDWRYLFTPALSLEEARLNQASAGIGCSFVYPLDIEHGGAMIFSYFLPLNDITEEHRNFMKSYANITSLALQSFA